MEENTEVVTGSEATAEEVVETPAPETPPAEAKPQDENRIPISRAEEMWRKREDKIRSEYVEREKQAQVRTYEAELKRLEALGLYKPEAPKPYTREDIEKMFTEREEKMMQQIRYQRYEDLIRTGWEQVASKHPKLATNKHFQELALAEYAKNPAVSLPAHADAIVKDFLDPYGKEKALAAQNERDEQRRPDRRVVPSGRGGAGGSGAKVEKQSVAQKIRNRLKEIRES